MYVLPTELKYRPCEACEIYNSTVTILFGKDKIIHLCNECSRRLGEKLHKALSYGEFENFEEKKL